MRVTRLKRAGLAVLASVVIPVALFAKAVPLPPPPTSAPATVTAIASSARVVLEWAPVVGATGYSVFRSTTGVWEATSLLKTTSTHFTNSGLTNGTPYAYRVSAYNKGGSGPVSSIVSATPVVAPLGVAAERGDRQVTLSWQASAGAVSYTVYRSLSSSSATFTEFATGVVGLSFVNTDLTNGTKYYYKVRAIAAGGVSALSAAVSATPQPPPPATAPANLVAVPGNARVTLTWDPVAAATSYRVFRTTTGTWGASPVATVTTPTFKNTGLTNGTAYSYKVFAHNPGGDGPASDVVTSTPVAPPTPPTDVTAVAADHQVTIAWTPVAGATGYKVFRGTASNRQATLPVAVALASPPFVDAGLANGPTYFYKVTAFNAGGESARSLEVSASPEGVVPTPDPATIAAFRLLRQATWGPKPSEVEALKTGGVETFLADQFAAGPSEFPDALFDQPVEATQEHFMHLALTGPDQLRQRVAFALHKIWVVSAVEVDSAPAIVTYYRTLLNGAFGNYRDLMRAVTLNPAMGRYLNMLNNRSEAVTGVAPNENYARELMQLFTLGIPKLSPGGVPQLDAAGQPISVYTEADVKALARIFTGWTFGDGNPATTPRRLASENYRVPMEAVVRYHDITQKTFLGEDFPANQTASQDLEHALDVLFNNPNMGPFIGRQLILQLVTSNPSPAYIAAVAAVFNDNGGGVRGDLAAVVRAVLTNPEAALSTASSGKLSEPVLFVVSQLRGLNATVTDHPFMSDKAEEMGQKVLYPPSVFSYFSPGYRVRGTVGPTGAPLGGPEFQILTTVTALVRVNFVGELLGGSFGDNVHVDYAPFTSLASDPAALVDYANLLFMGGRMSLEERTEIISAVRVSPANRLLERVRTAHYLTLVAAQGQVDR